MPLIHQIVLTTNGEMKAACVRGDSFICSWAASEGGLPVDITDAIGEIVDADGVTILDLDPHLTELLGVVGLEVPGSVTATIPVGDYFWTVQAKIDGDDKTLASGPYESIRSANYS